jgi:hypothetical protein
LWGVVNISEESCTSTIQRWHKKSATKHPVSIAFTFYTMKHVKHVLNSIYFQELPTKISQLKTSQKTKRRDDEYELCTKETFVKILRNLDNEKNAPVFLHLFIDSFSDKYVPVQVRTPLPKRLTSIFDKTLVNLPIEEIQAKCQEYLGVYSITKEQALALEIVTKQQTHCKQWNHGREGRVTASKIYQVTRTSLTAPSKSLVP